MSEIRIPAGYHSELNLYDTQIAIKTVKDFFQTLLAEGYTCYVYPLRCLWIPRQD